jgi:2-polyprenyl-3-methyl-5-hydroxy-6-metoxy-1,4-benzoquinol methylase
MKSLVDGYGYNERLFSGGIRRRLHLARFQWLTTKLDSLGCAADSVVELGCFDGKLLDFLPNVPTRYVGFDANWEGGLDVAKERRGKLSNCSFFQVSSPDEMHLKNKDIFEIAVIMETLEHIPPELIDGYLRVVSQHLNGYLFVTVPNEKGLVFLAKWIVKKVLSKDAHDFSFSELCNATLGRMDRIARDQRKGFDYQAMVHEIEKYFDVIDISGHPLGFLPHSLCFGIGIVAKPKNEK